MKSGTIIEAAIKTVNIRNRIIRTIFMGRDIIIAKGENK